MGRKDTLFLIQLYYICFFDLGGPAGTARRRAFRYNSLPSMPTHIPIPNTLPARS